MRTLVLGAALLALATPALAQRYDAPDYGYDRDYDARDHDRDGDVDARDRRFEIRNDGFGDRDERRYDFDNDGDVDARDNYLRDSYSRNDGRGYGNNGGYYNGYHGGYNGVVDWRPVVGRIAPRKFLRDGRYMPNPRRYGLPYAPHGTSWVRLHKYAGLIRDRDRVVIRVIRFNR